jgi:hypothetical protein
MAGVGAGDCEEPDVGAIQWAVGVPEDTESVEEVLDHSAKHKNC